MGSHVVGSPVREVAFDERRVLLMLEDGRALAAPLSWVGDKVAGWGDEERARWVRTEDGRGVNWPDAGHTSDDGAVNVWMLEQDALFEGALAELKARNWDASALTARDRSLVALWRLTADGLLQVLGNWGVEEVRVALAALDEIGAVQTHEVVDEFWNRIGPIAESDAVSTIDDVYVIVTSEGLSAWLGEIDEKFWDVAEELVMRVPLAFGPAPSAI